MGKNRKIRVGSMLMGAAVMAEMMLPEMVMASTQNHNSKPYITNQVTELLIQEIDEMNGTITVMISENGLTERSREKIVEGDEGTEGSVEKIADISDWTYRQLNIMTAAGVSDGDLYTLTDGTGMGPTVYNQTYATTNIEKDTPTVLNEVQVGALSESTEKELIYSLGVSYYYEETGRNRTWYIPGRINYSSCFEGLDDTTGVVCEAETYEGEDGMLMVRYKAKEGVGNTGGVDNGGGSNEAGGVNSGSEFSGSEDNGGGSGDEEEDTGLDDSGSGNIGETGDSGGVGNGGEDGEMSSDAGENGSEGEEMSSGADENGSERNEIGDNNRNEDRMNEKDEKVNIVTTVKEVPVIQEVVKIVEKEVPIVTKAVETIVKTAVQEVPVTRTLVREVARGTVYSSSGGSGTDIKASEAGKSEVTTNGNSIKKDVVGDGGMGDEVGVSGEIEAPALGEAETKDNWWVPFMIGLVSGGTGMGVAWWIVGRGNIREDLGED